MTVSKPKPPETRRFVPRALPQEFVNNYGLEIRDIMQSYQSTIGEMPADLLGAEENPMREEFVDQHVISLMESPDCLSRESVGNLLNDAFRKTDLVIPAGHNVVGCFIGITHDGLTKALTHLLKTVESWTILVSDEWLKDLGLTDVGVETFRGLLPSFSQSLDELMEVASML